MGLAERLLDVARAELNALLDRLAGRQPHRLDELEEDLRRVRAGEVHIDPPAAFDPKIAQFYANLEIPYGSDIETVRRAYKRLLRKYHPDLYSRDVEKARIANDLCAELGEACREIETWLEGTPGGPKRKR